MNKNLSQLGEFGLIVALSRRIKTGDSVVQGIGDDTAVVEFNKDSYLLLTTDMLIEGRHFSLKDEPCLIGQKAINCSVSDIAAMGGEPRHVLVSLGLSKKTPVAVIDALYRGMRKACRQADVSIVGGDTVANDRMVINVALTGYVNKNDLVLRSGAKEGDEIFVTGPLGGSLESGRHLKFTLRLKESQYLVKNFKPSSMIDVSDGLIADLKHILKNSKAGADLYEDQIPVRSKAVLNNALYDGEDFELIFTLNMSRAKALIGEKYPFTFYRVGQVTKKSQGLVMINSKGKRRRVVSDAGYDHFKK